MRSFLTLMILAVAGTGVLFAEEQQASLAERAEKARQGKAGKAPPRVLTNKDLRNAKGTVIVLPEPDPEPPRARERQETRAAAADVPPPPSGDGTGVAAPSAGAQGPASGQPPVPSDPASLHAAIQEESERAARYRRALKGAEDDLRAGGDRLGADRRAALTKFLEDGRREVARAEQALAELNARLQEAAARP